MGRSTGPWPESRFRAFDRLMTKDPLRMTARRARRRWRAFAIFAGVAAAEIGLFLLLGQVRGMRPPAVQEPPAFEVVLYDPPPPITSEPPSPEAGGGAPAAPSRVHAPPPPTRQPPPSPIPSPPVPAPQPDPIVVGAAPTPSPSAGFGQAGEGTGAGAGSGAGDGPGRGSTGPRLVTGPTIGQIRACHPRNARRRYGRAELSCVIRADRRLEACRVVSEDPPGLGFGAAGQCAVVNFRFQPPTEDGRPLDGQRVTVGIDFGRPR